VLGAPHKERIVIREEYEFREPLKFARKSLRSLTEIPRLALPDKNNWPAAEGNVRTNDGSNVLRALQRVEDSAKHNRGG
jgi:hypothetical protein